MISGLLYYRSLMRDIHIHDVSALPSFPRRRESIAIPRESKNPFSQRIIIPPSFPRRRESIAIPREGKNPFSQRIIITPSFPRRRESITIPRESKNPFSQRIIITPSFPRRRESICTYFIRIISDSSSVIPAKAGIHCTKIH